MAPENGSARLEQERNISFRFRMRTVTLLQHKGKLGLAIIIIAFMILSLITAITKLNNESCNMISREYRFCNNTLKSRHHGICYKYGKDKKALSQLYRNCIMDWGNRRCKRHLRVSNNETHLKTFFLPAHMHTFFVVADTINSEPVSVYAIVNRTCFLNGNEMQALFQVL